MIHWVIYSHKTLVDVTKVESLFIHTKMAGDIQLCCNLSRFAILWPSLILIVILFSVYINLIVVLICIFSNGQWFSAWFLAHTYIISCKASIQIHFPWSNKLFISLFVAKPLIFRMTVYELICDLGTFSQKQ